jgi:hypothetical protein
MFWTCEKKSEPQSQRIYYAHEAKQMTRDGLKIIHNKSLEYVMKQIEQDTKNGYYDTTFLQPNNYQLFKDEILEVLVEDLEGRGYKASVEEYTYKTVPYTAPYGSVVYYHGSTNSYMGTPPADYKAPEPQEVKSKKLIISWK